MINKIALITVVTLELVVGTVFLFRYFRVHFDERKALESNKTAVIDKTSVIEIPDLNFKYYYELRPNTTSQDSPQWLPYTAEYTINADGLNDRFDYDTEKQKNTVRIIALGDSFTFGHYVNTEDSWPEQLEDMLNQESVCSNTTFEVINLGMRGFDIPYLVKRYEDLGAKYNPDLVVWFESGSGFTRYLEKQTPLTDDCKNQVESEKKGNIDDKTQEKIWYNCYTQVEAKLKKAETYPEIRQLISRYFDRFFQLSDQSKVYYLTFQDIISEVDAESVFLEWRSKYDRATFATIVPNLRGDELLPDSHPSSLGQKVIAESIFSFLQQENTQLANCQ